MKNILHAREKYNECKEKLMVMVDDAKNLEQFVVQDGMKSNKLWSFIFKKSSNQKKDRLSG